MVAPGLSHWTGFSWGSADWKVQDGHTYMSSWQCWPLEGCLGSLHKSPPVSSASFLMGQSHAVAKRAMAEAQDLVKV